MSFPQMSSLCMFNVQKSLKSLWLTADTVISSGVCLKIQCACFYPVVRVNTKIIIRKWKVRMLAFADTAHQELVTASRAAEALGGHEVRLHGKLKYSKLVIYIPHFYASLKKKINPNMNHSIEQCLIEKRSFSLFPGLFLLECVWVSALCNSFQ